MKPRWGDYIIAVLVLFLAGMAAYKQLTPTTDMPVKAIITQHGEVVATILLDDTLDEPYEISLKDGYVLVRAEGGMIRFVYSDCPNQICVHTGWIEYPGQVAACIPNKIIVKIVGQESDLDVVLH